MTKVTSNSEFKFVDMFFECDDVSEAYSAIGYMIEEIKNAVNLYNKNFKFIKGEQQTTSSKVKSVQKQKLS
jgi:hypothetical protein